MPAYVLPQSASPSSEPQVFGDAFPGVYTPGVPVPLTEVGLSLDEAAELMGARELPLELVYVDPPADPAEVKPARTKADAAAQAKALGITFSEGDKTKLANMNAELAAARAAAGQGDVADSALDAAVEGSMAPSGAAADHPAEDTPAPGLTADDVAEREDED